MAQPIYCSFAADVICQSVGCGTLWRAYLPDGCVDINTLRFECPTCKADTGKQIRWWPSEIPRELQHDPYEGE